VVAARTVDEYISAFPAEVQLVLEELRRTIHEAVPGAGEKISYQMPAITLDGASLVHFAAWKHHIGLYPLPAVDGELQRQLAPYETGKGTARFPLDAEVPYELVARVVQRLVQQRVRAEA
jgi:uncharacterized protein YdhG (YjbR/CyaY superfamily)